MGWLRRRLIAYLPRSIPNWLLQSYRRPVGLFAGLLVLPLSVVLIVTYRVHLSLWRQQTLQNLHVTARLGAEIVNETLEGTLDVERRLVGERNFVESVKRRDADDITQQLREALRFARRVSAAVVMSPEGTVVAVYPESDSLVGSSMVGQEAFEGAREGGWRPYISGAYLREGAGFEKIVSVALPIRQAEQVVGLLLVQHQIEEIKAWLQKVRVEPEGFLYVVDHLDKLVVFPYQVVAGEPLVVSSWPPVALLVTAKGATLRFLNARTGEAWLAGVHPVGDSGWRVITVQREVAALRTLHRVFLVLGLLVGGLMALVGFIGWRWLQVHAFSLSLLEQNVNVLKQLSQARLLDRDRQSDESEWKPDAS